MILSLTSETAVEYTIWSANDTYIITVCWVMKTSRRVDDFYFLIRLLSRAWLWVISTYFEWRSSARCSPWTVEHMDLIEWYVQLQQNSYTNRVWFNKTTLRKNIISRYMGFDCINQHFDYSSVETGVLNGCLWRRKQDKYDCWVDWIWQHKKTLSRVRNTRENEREIPSDKGV